MNDDFGAEENYSMPGAAASAPSRAVVLLVRVCRSIYSVPLSTGVLNRLGSVAVVNTQQIPGPTDSILIKRPYAEQLPMLSYSVGKVAESFALVAPAISLKLDTIVMAGGVR